MKKRHYWTAKRKAEVVMRLFQGESLERLSQEIGVSEKRLVMWRECFVQGGKRALKCNRKSSNDTEIIFLSPCGINDFFIVYRNIHRRPNAINLS